MTADEFGSTIGSLVSDEDVQSQRETEDRQSPRLHFVGISGALG